MSEKGPERAGRREEGTEPPDDGSRGGGSWPRRILVLVLWLSAGLILLVGSILVALQFDGVSTRVGRWVAGAISTGSLQVRVESVTGSWIGGLTFTGLEVTSGATPSDRIATASAADSGASASDSRPAPGDTSETRRPGHTPERLSPGGWALAADTLSLSYDLLPLLRRTVNLGELRGKGVGFRMRMAPPDSAAKPDTAVAESPWRVRIGRAELRDTRVAITQPGDTAATGHGDGGEPEAWVLSDGVILAREIQVLPPFTARIDTIAGSFRPPGEPAGWGEIRGSLRMDAERVQVDTFLLKSPESDLRMRGTIPFSMPTLAPPGLDLTFAARPLSLRDIGPFLPGSLSDSIRLRAEGSARTSGDTLRVLVDAESGGAGQLRIDGKLAGTWSVPTVVGQASLDGIDLQAWGLTSSPLTADGSIGADVTGDRGTAHGSAGLEATVRDRRGTRTVHATLQARSDSTGDLWRGEWTGETAGIVAEGGLELEPGDVPSWALDGQVAYDRSAGAPEVPGLELHRLEGSFQGEGKGTALDSLDARVGLGIASARIGRARVDSLALSAGVEAGRATFALGGALAEGTLEARGEADLRQLTGRISELRVQDLDVMALLGDSTPSRISGSGSARLIAKDPLRAEATLELRESRYGEIRLDSATASVELEGHEASFETRAALADSARARARGRLAMRGDSLRLSLDTLTFANLDLRALMGSGGSAGGAARGGPAGAASAPSEQAVADAAGGSLSSDLTGGASGEILRTPAGLSGRVVLDVDSSTLGSQPVQDFRATAILRPGEVDIDLELVTPAGGAQGRVEVAGLEEGGTLAVSVPTLQLRSVDVGSLLGNPGMGVVLSGDLEAEVRGSALEEMTGSARLHLDSSRVAVTTVESGTLDLAFDKGTMEATLEAATGDGGDVSLQASADFAADVPTFRSRGTLRLPRLELPGARGDPGPTGYLAAHYELDGSGSSPDSARGSASLVVDSARWSGLPVDSARLQVALTDTGVRLDTLLIRSPAGTISAGGRLPRNAQGATPGELRLHAEVGEAALLEELIGARILALGTGVTDATARGSLEDLHLEVDSRVNALLWNDFRVQGLQLQARARRTKAEGFREASVEMGMDRFYVSGTPVRRLDLRAALEDNDEVMITATADIDDLRNTGLTAHLEGTPAPAAVRVESFTFRAEEDTWTLSHPARIQVKNGVQIDSLVVRADGQAIEARGRVAKEGPLDLRVDITSFDVETIGDLIGYPDLRGRLTGSMALGGTAADPTLDAELSATLDPETGSPVDLSFTAGYAERTMTLETGIDTGGGTGAQVSARLPLGLSLAGSSEGLLGEDSVQVTVTADSMALGWVSPLLPSATLTDLEGVVNGSVEIRGTGASPSFDGALVVSRFSVGVPPVGVRFQRGRARLVFQGDGVQVDSLRVRAGDGSLSGSGSVRFLPLDQPAFDLTLRPDGFLVANNSTVRAVVSGEVLLTGSLREPTAKGRLVVDEADLHLEELVSGPNVETVHLSEEAYREMARVFGYRPPEASDSTPSLWEDAAIDLSVELRRDSWIRMRSNPQLALQFTGGLTLEKPPGEELRLVGTIDGLAERSYVEQFGRRFSLASGTVTFRGDPTATSVDIRTEYAVPSRDNPGNPAVVIVLEITGTVGDLNLRLSSTPELEPSDMVSYIVTGAPASQTLGGNRQLATDQEGASLTSTGQALALSQLSGAVEAYAREQVGLDVVEITTDGLDGVTLLAGRYVSPDLYLGIRQPLSMESSSAGGRQNQRPELEAELEALRWLLLNLQAGGRSGIELYVRARIAYD